MARTSYSVLCCTRTCSPKKRSPGGGVNAKGGNDCHEPRMELSVGGPVDLYSGADRLASLVTWLTFTLDLDSSPFFFYNSICLFPSLSVIS